MSQVEFYPYATRPAALRFRLTSDPVIGDPGERTWQLFEAYPTWEEIELNLEVDYDPALYEHVLPEAEREDPPCRVVVALRSDASRRRESIGLGDAGSRDGRQVVGATTALKRRDFYGTIILEPLLIRTARLSQPVDGYAGQLGDRLAWGPGYELRIDPPDLPSPGGTLGGRWENFAEVDDEWLNQHRNNLFALRIGAEPELLLNTSVPGLHGIIEHGARGAKRARVRQATLDTLAVGVWQSLASASIAALYLAVADEAEEPLERLLPWQRGTLDRIAPRLYRPLNRADALARLIEALDGGAAEALSNVQARLFSAAQSLADSRKAFDGLLRIAEDRAV